MTKGRHKKMHNDYKETQNVFNLVAHVCMYVCVGALSISVPRGRMSPNPPMNLTLHTNVITYCIVT